MGSITAALLLLQSESTIRMAVAIGASSHILQVCNTPSAMVRDVHALSYISRGASSCVFHGKLIIMQAWPCTPFPCAGVPCWHPLPFLHAGIWQSAECAIKFLVSNFSVHSASVREALLGTELAHPNVVQCYAARCIHLDEAFIRRATAAVANNNESGDGQGSNGSTPWRSSFDSEDGGALQHACACVRLYPLMCVCMRESLMCRSQP